MNHKLSFILSLVAGLCLFGCAKKAENVAATYVSPIQYQSYSCRQIGEEAQRISQRVSELSGIQNKKRRGDIVATTAAVVVFWPAAFLVQGDDEQTAELARHKGELESMQQMSIQKNCGIQFQMAAPPPRQPSHSSDFDPFSG